MAAPTVIQLKSNFIYCDEINFNLGCQTKRSLLRDHLIHMTCVPCNCITLESKRIFHSFLFFSLPRPFHPLHETLNTAIIIENPQSFAGRHGSDGRSFAQCHVTGQSNAAHGPPIDAHGGSRRMATINCSDVDPVD